jgi:hypothetical protein
LHIFWVAKNAHGIPQPQDDNQRLPHTYINCVLKEDFKNSKPFPLSPTLLNTCKQHGIIKHFGVGTCGAVLKETKKFVHQNHLL